MRNTTAFASALVVLCAFGCAKKTPPPEEAAPAAAAETPKEKAPVPEEVSKLVANFRRVHFGFDSFDLNDETKNALSDNSKILMEHKDVRVEVQGHADEQGTSEYNLQLGEKRAKAVRDYLIRSGVGEKQIETISYGEEKPVSKDSGESAWSENRRAEFRVLWGSDMAVGTTD